MIWTHCEVYWDLDFEPSETSGGQPVALGASVFGLHFWDSVQSGLTISPLMGTCLQYSLDFCLAWALIGEWTSRVLFPVPKGPWPRHGHAGALLRKLRKLGTRILLPPALLSKQQDSPQLPQWIVNPFRTTQAHRTRSVLFT